MLTITIQVDKPSGQAIGIKEAIAQDLEKSGDVRIISIVEEPRNNPRHEQMTMFRK